LNDYLRFIFIMQKIKRKPLTLVGEWMALSY